MTAIRTGLWPALAAVLAVAAGPASSSLIDFEPFPPDSLFFPADTFDQAGFRMTVGAELGVIGTAAGTFLNPPLAPTGNATQFYGGFNDGHLTVALIGGGVFSLTGFDAAFIAPGKVGAGVDPGFIIAQAVDTSNVTHTEKFAFGPSAADETFPFLSYAGAAFGTFAKIVSVEFYACTFDVNGDCVNLNQNLSQFSIDNINVAAAPEPASLALMVLGLAGLAARKRRRMP